MKKRIFALVTGSLLAFTGMAQEQDVIRCGAYEALESLHQQFPELKAEYELNQELLLNSLVVEDVVVNGQNQKTATYVIPVVFHILHEYGSENVSDASIYALMEDLNKDYSATNADLSQVVPEFDTVIGTANIEWRLAAIDPFGNCTNGIDHIYTHETNFGESVSKLNQWNRSHYLNVWVAAEPNSGGTIQGVLLGYATFPTSTDGNGFWTDGVMLRDYTVTNNDRTLTHEIGHYLGLCHTFGCTGTAGDGVCGNDGLYDTPSTDGDFSTCNLARENCDTTINPVPIANVQNYMDYSSCVVMFTEDQVDVMHNTLEGISGQRSFLWQDSTLQLTGVDNATMPQSALTVPLCTPVADFYTPDGVCSTGGSSVCTRTVCQGSSVSFKDASWNAVIDGWEWTFQDGTPATSNAQNPTVTFNSSGWKQVTLTVSNTAGSDTRSESHYIFVSADWADNVGPTVFDMENTSTPGTGTDFFLVENVENNFGKFSVVDGVGYDDTKAWKLQTYFDNSESDPFTDDYFYNNRLGGSFDRLITPSMDLRYTTGVNVSFKYSYATNATATADITEELKVYTSRDCGESWTPRILNVNGTPVGNTITGDDLVTAGYASNSDFTPTTNTQWGEATFTYTTSSLDSKTRIMFEFRASDNASNLYIDDINVSGTLNLQDVELSGLDLQVFPNPSAGEAINVSFQAQDQPTVFTLMDAQGKVIANQVIDTTNAEVSTQLKGTENLPSACYFLEVTSGDHKTTRKVVVL